MVTFVFSVDDDPPHSGFSLGHLDITGSMGTATTRGSRSPDERMMVYPQVTQLLWDTRVLADAGKGQRSFTGIDTTFDLRSG